MDTSATTIDKLKERIALEPENAELYIECAEIYYNEENYLAAIKDCTRAIELQPNVAKYYRLRGNCYRDIGLPHCLSTQHYEDASKDYTKAIDFDPGHADDYWNREFCYFELGDYEEAVHNLTVALPLAPDHDNATDAWTRGDFYKNSGKYHEAIKVYNTMVQNSHAGHSPTYLSRAECYYAIEECAKGIEDIQTAVETDLDHYLLDREDIEDIQNLQRKYYEALLGKQNAESTLGRYCKVRRRKKCILLY